MLQKIALVGVVAAGLVGGYFWPSHPAPLAGAPGTIEESVTRSGDGHFYVDALVNGKSIHFLVDTGSSAIALSPKDASTAGIPVDRAEFTYLGDGAAGMVRGKEVKLDKVAVGRIEQEDVDAVVVDNAEVSLLGMPFLNNVDEIVIRKGEMMLRKGAGG